MDTRTLLERYVASGSLMQVSTLDEDTTPRLCHVWYQAEFHPDTLRFISRNDRRHSANIRRNPHVAGGIVTIPLTGLGQTVQGVTFQGRAVELPASGTDAAIGAFLTRWPNARKALDPAGLVDGGTGTWLYEIRVTSWVLFDEEHFPDDPRQEPPAL